MRKLHLVGLTTDRDGLIFTARKGSKSGGFIVPLDDTLITAVVEVQAARNGGRPEAEDDRAEIEAVPRRPRHQSALTPREMQARLRSGRSIDEVAAEAGVDNDWVARFAVPILAEQAQVVELARGLVYAKPRLGESSERLGPSVMQNLSDRGIFLPDDIADAGWSAFQLHDSVWMVRFRYRSRGRNQEAQWEVDVPAGRLLARNRLASDLGYVDAARRRRLATEEELAEEEPLPAPRRSAGAAARTSPAGRAAVTKIGTQRKRAPAAKTATGTTAAGKTAGASRTGRARAGTAAATRTPAGRATTRTSPARTAAGKIPAAKTAAGGATAAPSSARRARAAQTAAAAATSPARRAGASKTAARRTTAGPVTPSARPVTARTSATRKAGSSPTPTARKAGSARKAAGATASGAPARGATSRRGSRASIGATANASAPPPDMTSTPRRTRNAAAGNPPAPAPGVAKVGTPGGPPRAPAGSRPAKASGSGAEAGPPAQTGAVRSAVAQIATARVSASMASAERAPWAGVVGPGTGPRLATRNGNEVRTSGRSSSSAGARNRPSAPLDDDLRPAFEPRPLPAGGDPALARRVRKLPTPPPRIEGGTPAVSLPAPRVPSPRQEPIPVERTKRRRLRSR
ncbi:MAG TPA: septation protein SepH [Acidimicrobiales bacterium]|nr:septation protein SepH [Acidimicrobiales bacterium]